MALGCGIAVTRTIRKLDRGERDRIIDFTADHYGWDHRRVGGDIDPLTGAVYVGSNYAGHLRLTEPGVTVLVLDRVRPGNRTNPRIVPLAAVLSGVGEA